MSSFPAKPLLVERHPFGCSTEEEVNAESAYVSTVGLEQPFLRRVHRAYSPQRVALQGDDAQRRSQNEQMNLRKLQHGRSAPILPTPWGKLAIQQRQVMDAAFSVARAGCR